MDKASVFGTEDCEFESRRGRFHFVQNKGSNHISKYVLFLARRKILNLIILIFIRNNETVYLMVTTFSFSNISPCRNEYLCEPLVPL